VRELIQKVKESEFDYEFYPTTSEIIKIINSDIHKQYSKFEISILDIGAGNGNFFKILESLNQEKSDCKFIKYAIEKSPILIENMNPDIFIVGTEFHEQTLIDKKTDIIFCNPPYSEYESWTEKIIAEGNCDIIYMVIPERWKSNKKIKEIISKRGFSYKVIGNTDFIDSEYRQARAKVDIIRFKCKVDRVGDHSYNCTIKDPFDLWFDNFFKIKAQPKEDDYLSKRQKEEEKKENIKKHLIKGQNLIERLEDLYRKDFENLLNNYRKIEELDYEIFKELGIDLNNLKEGLKLKISGLKNLYWHELFDNMETITSRLTKKSREKLLKKLTDHTTIDFTSGNAYAIVLWAIKNANIYLDEQLKEVYLWMTRTENIQNYKSNQRMIKDDWRYCQEHTHYTLDYRLVLHGYNNFNSGSWGNYNYPNGLNSQTHDSINDMITIGKNLGFDINENSFDFEWEPGKSVDFTCQKGLFMSVRAYKNGNIHVKANQEFMKKLNIEAGRLNGWVKSPEEAAEEMNIPITEIKELFGSNLQLAISQYKMLT
jgi:predicted RNA methylase